MIKNAKRKDGRVKASVYLGNGKYKYVYANNNRELDRKVQEIKLQLGKGIDVSAERDTFGQWAERWLKLKKLEVSNGRYNTYSYRVKNLAPITFMQIGKIRTADIQDIIIGLSADGYALKTLKDVKNAASQIFRIAVDNRVIDYNPAISVKLHAEAPKETRHALTTEEQQFLLRCREFLYFLNYNLEKHKHQFSQHHKEC